MQNNLFRCTFKNRRNENLINDLYVTSKKSCDYALRIQNKAIQPHTKKLFAYFLHFRTCNCMKSIANIEGKHKMKIAKNFRFMRNASKKNVLPFAHRKYCRTCDEEG